jgi:NAD+ diphosphatase
MAPSFNFCPKCATPLALRGLAGRERKACPKEGCGYVFYDNPLPVVAALLEHEGQVILARNKGWPGGWFGLITGFLERDETPEAGVLREVEEELGLSGEILGLIGVYAFFEMNQIIITYHLKATGEIRLGEELEAYKKVPPDKLRPWALGTGLAVRDWLAARFPSPMENPPAGSEP